MKKILTLIPALFLWVIMNGQTEYTNCYTIDIKTAECKMDPNAGKEHSFITFAQNNKRLYIRKYREIPNETTYDTFTYVGISNGLSVYEKVKDKRTYNANPYIYNIDYMRTWLLFSSDMKEFYECYSSYLFINDYFGQGPYHQYIPSARIWVYRQR